MRGGGLVMLNSPNLMKDPFPKSRAIGSLVKKTTRAGDGFGLHMIDKELLNINVNKDIFANFCVSWSLNVYNNVFYCDLKIISSST